MAKTRTFADIDLSFTPHPATGDLIAKYDDNAIKNAVKNLILTKHYERPFHSELGSNATTMLFELPSPALTAVLDSEIRDVLRNFEPRVVVLDVVVRFTPDEQAVSITIVFKIVNTERPITLQFTLDRTR